MGLVGIHALCFSLLVRLRRSIANTASGMVCAKTDHECRVVGGISKNGLISSGLRRKLIIFYLDLGRV